MMRCPFHPIQTGIIILADDTTHYVLLKEWKTWDEQIGQVDEKTVERANHTEPDDVFSSTQILMTAPGVSDYSGLALASRIGPVERFPRPRSLANYFGLTPGCRNSGNVQDCLGSITKEGSKIARFILGQLVLAGVVDF